MAKKIELVDKAHKAEHLKNFHPFLKEGFRTVLKSELENEEVLKELFGDGETEFYKLAAVYEIQNL